MMMLTMERQKTHMSMDMIMENLVMMPMSMGMTTESLVVMKSMTIILMR